MARSGIIAHDLARPKPIEILACARRIERELGSRKVVKANIAMGAKTIAKHLSAAFDELGNDRKYMSLRQESTATLLANVQRLLVYAAYKNSLTRTMERPWPTLSAEQAVAVAEEMRKRGIGIGGNIEKLFSDAVDAVRGSS